jgi:DNA-binding XRE family transcriptional regulator
MIGSPWFFPWLGCSGTLSFSCQGRWTFFFAVSISPTMRTRERPKPSPFGVSLRKLRQQKRFTLRQLGEMAGLPFQTIDMIEMGTTQVPSVDTAGRLAKSLDAKIVQLPKGAVLESVFPES